MGHSWYNILGWFFSFACLAYLLIVPSTGYSSIEKAERIGIGFSVLYLVGISLIRMA
jgi:hypothetical protein